MKGLANTGGEFSQPDGESSKENTRALSYLNGRRRLDALPLMLGIRRGNPVLPCPFNTTLEFIARAIKQEKSHKSYAHEERSK